MKNIHKKIQRRWVFPLGLGWFLWCCAVFIPLPWSVAHSTDSAASHGADSALARRPAGDRIIMGTIGEAANLLPPLASDSASREISNLLFISLLKYDKELNIVPWAAESFEVLDGGLRLRFTLRKGITWEDGVEMTASDVEYTYRMMIDPATPTAYAGDFHMVSSFTVLDRYSIEIRYEKPFARSLVTWMSSIMPRHLLENTDLTKTPYARKPLGNGPFRLREWVPGSRVVLEASPTYFEGRPRLDGVLFSVIPDITTMFLELKAGRVDMMGLSPQQYVYQARDSFMSKEFNVFRYLAFAYTYLGYNMESPLFKDVRVRRAFAHAIDPGVVIAGALLGQGVPTIGPFIPGSWPYNTELTPHAYDPAKARALLAEAGWKPDAQGLLRNEKGLPFSFTILTNQGNEQRIKTAVILQSQLRAIGVDVRIRTVEWAVFLSQFIQPGFYDAMVMGWTVPLDPDLFDVWHSANIKPQGLNIMRYANTELDAILVEARTTFDRGKRKKLYDRVQEILHEEQPYCFLYVPYSLPAVQKRFNGVEASPAGWDFTEWWVAPEHQRYTEGP